MIDFDLDEHLWKAVGNGNHERIVKLLEAGADINSILYFKGPPITCALRNADPRTAMLLAEHGADLKLADAEGLTPMDRIRSYSLHHHLFRQLMKEAIQGGNVGLVKRLTDAGLEPDWPQSEDYLHWPASLSLAICDNRTEIARTLIRAGAKTDIKNRNGELPLYQAAALGNHEIVECLLNAGAPVDARDSFHRTALLAAVSAGSLPTIRLLIKAGADVNKLNMKLDGNFTSIANATIMGGNPEVLQYLFEHGMSLENHGEVNARTLLMVAVKTSRPEIVERLIKLGAKIEAVDDQGRTPLHHAIIAGNAENTKALLDVGADPNVPDQSMSRSPLHYAATSQKPGLVQMLLKHGANPNALDREGDSPLTLAVKGNRLGKCLRLLEAGANPFHLDKGNSVLMHAVFHGMEDLVQVLLPRSSASLGQRNAMGNTALHLAALRERLSSIELLLGAGADANAVNEQDMTPIDVARERGSRAAISIFENWQLKKATSNPGAASTATVTPGRRRL